MSSESERLRYDASDRINDQSRKDEPSAIGSQAFAAVTTTVTTYPTTASAFYACQRLIITGDEIEGGTATIATDSGVFYAWNAGTAIPPNGTQILVRDVEYRNAFRFDG